VTAGRSQLCQVPLASTGTAALTVNASIGPPGGASGFDPGTWTVQPGCSGKLAAGRRCAIPVLIKVPAGASEGPVRARLTIKHNAPNSPSTVLLQATIVRR
jgi:hypothetical protein